MLAHLSISNYALIDNLDIKFSDGLSIITGETGAGKSILLGALSLVLGQRADTQVLLDKSKKCFVEATFSVTAYGMESFFLENELDYDETAVLRREVNPNGKSRAFINDTPVTLDLIKAIGDQLVDIHSQHKTLNLQEAKFQLAYIDSYAEQNSLVEKFKTDYTLCSKRKSELSLLLEQEQKSKSDKEYFEFQFNELIAANIKTGEQQELERELEILNHSEEIKLNLGKAYNTLSEGDANLCSGLSDLLSLITKTASIYPELSVMADRMKVCNIELKDISREIESLSNRINYDPQRISEINERLDTIYHLQQKHRVKSVDELLAIKESYAEKLDAIGSLDKQISTLSKKIADTEKSLKQLADKISLGRRKAIPQIEKGVTDILRKLAMPAAVFSIEHVELKELNSLGNDKVTFMFCANKGGEKKEISKAASGGELSRLMLAVKSLISERRLLPTIIFDEIDQGVSGEIADKVGGILKKMSSSMQVITITHLPQIASKGTTHFRVYKESGNNSTFTKIQLLEPDERITEIAKMLSGDELTGAAVENAKALLKTKN